MRRGGTGTLAVRDVAHVERSSADLRRGGRRHGRTAAAGVIVRPIPVQPPVADAVKSMFRA